MSKLATIRLISVMALAVLLGSMLAACAPAFSEGGGTEATATPDGETPLGDLAVYVPAGHFYMGSDPDIDPLAEEDELPLHNVLLPGYFIYRNEVSNGFYKQCVAAGVCSEPQMFDEPPSTHYTDPAYDKLPVVGVNWEQASTFCGWAEARLPTEAEWEKAARGELGNYYPWGDDSPSCDLNNMEGCITDPPDTDEIGQHPEGESFYEADDMAGNVWEWTADIFDAEYYQQSPDVNPAGPESGDLRTVRGGSFDSSQADLRSSARMGMDPNEAFNNVGFRCVPMGEKAQAPISAPFCQPSYTEFCRNPDGGTDDCTPPTTQGGEPGGDNYDLTGFGCPNANGQVTVTIDGPIGDDHTVNVGGYDFNCVESGIPDRWLCTGPHPVEGTLTTITVCPDTSQGANNGNTLVAYQPTPEGPAPQLQGVTPTPESNDQLVAFENSKGGSGDQLVAYEPQAAVAARPALQAYTPPSGGTQTLVAYQSAANYCPEGYIYNPTTQQCEQDPNGACPEGWSYNPDTQECDPGEQDGCPEGTSYNADTQSCTPDNGQECPDGYTYTAANNSCEPPANDDGGSCPAGYFFDTRINCCSPIVDDGCDDGSYRSAETNECMPLDENGCQEGYSYNRYEGACVPDQGGQDGGGDNPTGGDGCSEGYVMNDAEQCVPGDTTTVQRELNVQCGIGGYWDPNLLVCVYPGEGNCSPGFHRGPVSDACLPNDGPQSGCPIGFAYSERAGCCVDQPGNDGSSCPGDNNETRSLTALSAAPTNYDNGQGYCDPESGEPCPEGYVFDEQQDGCVPAATGRILQTACPEGTTYDEQLGYCVQDQCGCPLGTYMNPDTQQCVPYNQTGEESCWTYTVSVPECPDITPTPHPECDNDEKWNPQTLQCERIPDDEPTCREVCVSGAYLCSLGPPYATYQTVCE